MTIRTELILKKCFVILGDFFGEINRFFAIIKVVDYTSSCAVSLLHLSAATTAVAATAAVATTLLLKLHTHTP